MGMASDDQWKRPSAAPGKGTTCPCPVPCIMAANVVNINFHFKPIAIKLSLILVSDVLDKSLTFQMVALLILYHWWIQAVTNGTVRLFSFCLTCTIPHTFFGGRVGLGKGRLHWRLLFTNGSPSLELIASLSEVTCIAVMVAFDYFI